MRLILPAALMAAFIPFCIVTKAWLDAHQTLGGCIGLIWGAAILCAFFATAPRP